MTIYKNSFKIRQLKENKNIKGGSQWDSFLRHYIY